MSGYSWMTLEQAEARYRFGGMSERDFREYKLAWEWTAFRHTKRHEIAYKKLGKARYWQRINRARIRCGFEPYDLAGILAAS